MSLFFAKITITQLELPSILHEDVNGSNFSTLTIKLKKQSLFLYKKINFIYLRII